MRTSLHPLARWRSRRRKRAAAAANGPTLSGVDELSLTFRAVAEPWPGTRWQARFEQMWPAYERWFLRDGDAARPSYPVARKMLATHMPELVPAWERMVDLAGGGDLAARMLALYDPPPLVSGCSQAVYAGAEPVLVRNYDFDPSLLEGVIHAGALTGRRVIGMTDCLWGLLDGMNDAGLSVSLAFGGRRVTGEGFAVPLVVRYLLEVCGTTGEALEVLRRLPVQAAYNLTLLDRRGAAVTACVAADRAPEPRGDAAVATNHPHVVEWPEHARVTSSVEREERILELLADPAIDEDAFVGAFLEPPLRSDAYASGFGTLYTAVHRPADGTIEYRWPADRWRQSFDAFEEGERVVALNPREDLCSSSRA
jgi:predicted choloylglycine hydrolase